MIISEKQILKLMNICLEYYGLLALLEAKPIKQLYILDAVEEIQKQSDELKEIE